MNIEEYNEILAFHPGYYISEIIDETEITQDEFAKRLGTTPKTLSKIVNGKAKLSNEIAYKLSVMLDTSVDMWLNLQKEFDCKCLEISNKKALDEQIEILKQIDYSYFVKNNFIKDTSNISERIRRICSFLSISNLTILLEPDLCANFRSGIKEWNEKNIINNNIWLAIAIKIARDKSVKSYNPDRLKEYLPEIRGMTMKSPDVFVPRLKEIFAECGVSFVLLPKMKNAAINGAVKWLSSNKAVLAVCDRRNYADTFWFSLFHEIKHIFQHKVTYVGVTGIDDISDLNNSLEKAADEFSRNYLIPPIDYDRLIKSGDYSKNSIIKFANSIGIAPGIVVGRLQNDKIINYGSKLNSLRTKYVIY